MSTGLNILSNSICRWLCRLGLCLCFFVNHANAASVADSGAPPQRKPLVLALASLTSHYGSTSVFSRGHADQPVSEKRYSCFSTDTRSRLRKTFDQTWRRLRTAFDESSRRLSSGLSRLQPARLIPFIAFGWQNRQDEVTTEIADIDIGFFLDEQPSAAMTPFAEGGDDGESGSRRLYGRISGAPDEGLTRLGQVRSEWDYRDSMDGLEILPTVSFGAVYRF